MRGQLVGELVDNYPVQELPALTDLTARDGFIAFLEQLWPDSTPLDLTASLDECALDSLQWFELVAVVEAVLDETLPKELVASWASLADVHALLVLRADQECLR